MSTISHLSKFTRAALAALTVLAFTAPLVEARPGGSVSTGSRGLKTYTPPPSTRTAPGTATPMQRSTQPAPQAARPGAPAPAAAAPSRFGGGFMGGLLGAGLIGALLGAGFFGGMGSLLGILGFVLQVAVIGGLAYLAFSYFFARRNPQQAVAAAAANPSVQRTAMQDGPRPQAAGGSMIGSSLPNAGTNPLAIEPADFDSFERLLSVIQLSFGREDKAALRSATTGEMLGYFTEQLDENAAKGVHNMIDAPKLLSGDLAESWSEASGEYATVAMRYELMDATVERTGGRVVAGSRTDLQQVTEVWTFTRRPGGGPSAWRLSAIQQVS